MPQFFFHFQRLLQINFIVFLHFYMLKLFLLLIIMMETSDVLTSQIFQILNRCSFMRDCKNMQFLFFSTSFKFLIRLWANTIIWKCIYWYITYMLCMHIHTVLQFTTYTEKLYIYMDFFKKQNMSSGSWTKDDLYCRHSFIFMLAVFRWKVTISFKSIFQIMCFQTHFVFNHFQEVAF